MDWTRERVAELKVLIEGGSSRGAIAQVWGISRNAVIGKVSREGFISPYNTNMGGMASVFKRRAEAKKKTRITRMLVQKKKKPPQFNFPIRTDEPAPLRIPYLELRLDHCRWLCDGTDDNCLPLSCGHPAFRGSSWCEHHYGRSHQ